MSQYQELNDILENLELNTHVEKNNNKINHFDENNTKDSVKSDVNEKIQNLHMFNSKQYFDPISFHLENLKKNVNQKDEINEKLMNRTPNFNNMNQGMASNIPIMENYPINSRTKDITDKK